MFYYIEQRSEPEKLRWYTSWSAIILAVVLILTGTALQGTPVFVNPAGAMLFCLLIATALMVLQPQPLGFIFDPSICLAFAAFLSLGLMGALLSLFAGSLIAEYARQMTSIRQLTPLHTRVQSLKIALWNANALALMLGVSGLVYRLVQGAPLPDGTHESNLILLMGLAIANSVVMLILRSCLLSGLDRSVLLLSIIVDFSLGLLGAFLALLFTLLSPINFAGLAGIYIVLSLMQRQVQSNNSQLQRQIRDLAALNRVSQALTVKLSTGELLETLYLEVTKLVPAELFVVALLDNQKNLWTFPYVALNGKKVDWSPTDYTNGLGEYILKTRQPLLVRGDVPQVLQTYGISQELTPPIPKTLITLPLISSDEVIGVLSVESLTSRSAYTQADVDLLMMIAPQAAAALYNAQLYGQVMGLVDELAHINQVSSLVSATLDLNSILDTVCNALRQGLADKKVAVFLLDEQRTMASLVHGVGFSDNFQSVFESVPATPEFGLNTEVLAISNLRNDSRGTGWQRLADIEGFTAIAFAPMRSNEQVIGQLAIFYDTPHLFSDSELNLLNTLANQVSVAVSNARLYNESEQRAEEMEMLVGSSHALIESFEMTTVGTTTVERLQDALDLSDTAILLWDIVKEQLQPLAQSSDPLVVQILQNADLFYNVIEKQIPLNLPGHRTGDSLLEGLGLRVALVLPLVLRSDTVGIVFMGRKQMQPFTTRERQFAETLLNQSATALDNARLFRLIDTELEERIQQLSAIESVSRKISATLDRQTVIEELLNVAIAVTDSDTVACGLEIAPGQVHIYRRTRASTQVHEATTGWNGITGRVFRTGKYEIVTDVSSILDYYMLLPGMKSELTVPIILNGHPIGVLDMEASRPDAFGSPHLSFMTTLAEHAAIAIEKSQIFMDVQRRNEEMRAILNSARDGMILVGAHGELVQSNPAAERILGIELKPYQGRNLLLALARNNRRPPNAQSVPLSWKDMRPILVEHRADPTLVTKRQYHMTVQEQTRDIEEVSIPVTDDRGATVARLYVLRDITEETELERFKEHLTETVVHDLRSPLGSIITSLYLIEEATHDQDLSTIERVLPSSLSLAKDLLNLVISILEIRKMQNGKLSLDLTDTPLQTPVQKAVQTVELPAAEFQIRILNRISPEIPLLHIDADKVRRVLVNLLDNATKFTPDKGEVRIEADYQPGDKMVTVTVVDTGKGIPEEYRDKVFELFMTIPKEVSVGRRRGTGIGLTFCRLTVEAHGGRIWVESGPEGGAAIRFTLPVSESPSRTSAEFIEQTAIQTAAVH